MCAYTVYTVYVLTHTRIWIFAQCMCNTDTYITQTHIDKCAQTFTHYSRPHKAWCVMTDFCVYFWCCRRGRRDKVEDTVESGSTNTHKHTRTRASTQTCCLLPAKATKWSVPFSLIMAVVQVTWATHNQAVRQKKKKKAGPLSDTEQHWIGSNYITLICSFQHLLIKWRSLGLRRAFSLRVCGWFICKGKLMGSWHRSTYCTADTEQHED